MRPHASSFKSVKRFIKWLGAGTEEGGGLWRKKPVNRGQVERRGGQWRRLVRYRRAGRMSKVEPGVCAAEGGGGVGGRERS